MIYPKHIALIPDGNRTWAKEKGLPQLIGHMEGFNRGIELIKYTFTNTPVTIFTAWGLSTENLTNRTQEELTYLFDLYKKITKDLEDFMIENKINYKWVGSSKGLPQDLVDYFLSCEEKFKCDSDRYVILAINYGGRDEITRGINRLIESGISKINSEEEFNQFLDFGGFPPVDLVIRTKGDSARRLSGFMLWWVGYAELYFTDKKCPELTVEEFEKALNRFDEISNKRNFGK